MQILKSSINCWTSKSSPFDKNRTSSWSCSRTWTLLTRNQGYWFWLFFCWPFWYCCWSSWKILFWCSKIIQAISRPSSGYNWSKRLWFSTRFVYWNHCISWKQGKHYIRHRYLKNLTIVKFLLPWFIQVINNIFFSRQYIDSFPQFLERTLLKQSNFFLPFTRKC